MIPDLLTWGPKPYRRGRPKCELNSTARPIAAGLRVRGLLISGLDSSRLRAEGLGLRVRGLYRV